jgi:transposase
MTIFIGLDVHSKETFYCAQDEDGNTIAEDSVATTEKGIAFMLERLKAAAGTELALETGAQAVWMSRLLESQGMRPRVIDAREVRAKARRRGQKSDRRDAFDLCDGLRRGIYVSIVWVPPGHVQRLREVLSRRRHFVRQATAQVNAAKFLLRTRGIHRTGPLGLSCAAHWERLLELPDVQAFRHHIEMHAAMWRVAREHVAALEREMAEASEPMRETIRLLMSVPGVGPVTAATFAAVIGAPERFADSAHVASYIGLTPSTYDSGERERHGSITKCGSPALRAALVEAALHARKGSHPLNPYYARVAAKVGHKKAAVSVAARLARILFQMWRRHQPFDVTKLNVERSPRTLSRTLYYQIRKPAA